MKIFPLLLVNPSQVEYYSTQKEHPPTRWQDIEFKGNAFHDSYGVNLAFTDNEGYTMVTVADTLPRKCYLNIGSFIGFGGEHHYATLHFFDLSFRVAKRPKGLNLKKLPPYSRYKIGEVKNITGAYDRVKPFEALGLTIEITRPVTEKDVRKGDTFRGYKVGDVTDRMDTKEEAIIRAQTQFSRLFTGEWKLEQ